MGNLSIKKKEEALIKAGRTVDDKGKVDVTRLDDQTIKRCRDITKGITDSDSLKKFGSDIVSTGSDCVSTLLELNKLDKAGEAGRYVKELISTIRKNELKDPSTMKGWRKFVAMIPVFGTPAVLSADKIMARYESSKDDVNKIIAKVKEMEVDLDSDMNSLVLMEQRAEELCEYYGVHVVALAVLYNDETEKLQKMLKEFEQDPSSHSQSELDKQREFVEKIDRHSFDLFMAGQKTHNLDLPQIRMMRQNNERLRENNEEIYRTIIPNWETSIAIAIMNQKQRAVLETQKAIKDVNNELTLNNAKMMKETTSKILVEGSRSIIDVETYKKAMNDVFTALSDTTEKLAHIKEQRDNDRAEIVKANKEMSAKMLELSKRSENLLLSNTEFVPDALK
jgi:putative toxic anion resistance protein